MRMRRLWSRRRTAVWAAVVLTCLCAGGLVRAADSAISAFTTKTQTVVSGETIVFEIGVTPDDNSTWDPASVSATVNLLGSNGQPVQTSDPVVPTEALVPNRTTPLFVSLVVGAEPAGAYLARASVSHSGRLVGTSETIAIAIGTVAAKAAPAAAPGAPPFTLHATMSGNDSFQSSSSQSGHLGLQAKFAGDRSAELKFGVANPAGGSQPIVTYQTPGSTTQFGTYSL